MAQQKLSQVLLFQSNVCTWSCKNQTGIIGLNFASNHAQKWKTMFTKLSNNLRFLFIFCLHWIFVFWSNEIAFSKVWYERNHLAKFIEQKSLHTGTSEQRSVISYIPYLPVYHFLHKKSTSIPMQYDVNEIRDDKVCTKMKEFTI